MRLTSCTELVAFRSASCRDIEEALGSIAPSSSSSSFSPSPSSAFSAFSSSSPSSPSRGFVRGFRLSFGRPAAGAAASGSSAPPERRAKGLMGVDGRAASVLAFCLLAKAPVGPREMEEESRFSRIRPKALRSPAFAGR